MLHMLLCDRGGTESDRRWRFNAGFLNAVAKHDSLLKGAKTTGCSAVAHVAKQTAMKHEKHGGKTSPFLLSLLFTIIKISYKDDM